MIRTYVCGLRPTKKQAIGLSLLLAHLCELYNAALQERRDAWKVCHKRIDYYDQQAELTQLRRIDAESAVFAVAIQRDPLRRVARAFDGFFRRCKTGLIPGYPRFRSVSRYDSFTADAQSFGISGDSLSIARLGTFRIHTRQRIRGTTKTLHVKRVGCKWRAIISCDIGPAPDRVVVTKPVGMDVGLTTLAALSDGREIANPRWTRQAEDRLARGNRKLASRRKGSKNRAKARERLRRIHEGIKGRRQSYLHSVSRWLLANYNLIAYEKLNICNMVRGNFAKSIMDAAWGELIWQLTYKAEKAGAWLIPVDPRGTTQLCSGCGEKVPKDIAQRQHDCPACGLSMGRDHNAAINVLQRGLRCAETSARVQV